MSRYVGALDQGTTSTRFMIFDHDGATVTGAQRETRQIYPQPGWVEQDAAEIWDNAQIVIARALSSVGLAARDLAAVAAASTTAFRDKLQPLLIGGTGIRVFGGLSVAAPSGRPGPRTLYVLAHVDVFPAGKDQAVDLVRALADAGRKDNGNLWFDVLQQDGRPNHFTLFEGWRDRKAFDASITTAHTKEFRQKLNPLEGALYDERLYQAVH